MTRSQLARCKPEVSYEEKTVPSDEISRLTHQLETVNLQLIWMMKQLNALDSKVSSHNQFSRTSQSNSDSDYSAAVQLAFRVVKLFFLFLLGFAIACLFSASLNASFVIETLLNLMRQLFTPLVALIFCIIAGAVVLESCK